MKYYAILIDDSGAAEFKDSYYDISYNHKNFLSDLKISKKFPDKDFSLDLEMYEDDEFNSLNDFIHAPIDFIVNDQVKLILQRHNLPPHVFLPANVSRIEKKYLIKRSKNYKYNWFFFDCEYVDNYYEYIDFEKSKILFFKGKDLIDIKVQSITDIYELIKENHSLSHKINEVYKDKKLNDKEKSEKSMEFQTFDWVAESIVLNQKFPRDIDVFNLPLFSWMTFVSEKLIANLVNENILDIKFIETGKKSKLEGVRNPKIIIE